MSLHLSKCHIVGNHMSRLIYKNVVAISLISFSETEFHMSLYFVLKKWQPFKVNS